MTRGGQGDSYLNFSRVGSGSAKTQVWDVCSITRGNSLGQIRFYSQWRQYAFWPVEGCLFNPSCLESVAEFTQGLTRDWKALHKSGPSQMVALGSGPEGGAT